MPIVSYNGDSFSCSKAVKGIDYINLYEGDILSVKFEGVVDFSAFTITEGDWSEPAGVEEARGPASIVDGQLIIDIADEIGDGTLIKFCAPCGCESITAGTKIGDTVYDIVDAAGNIMTGPGGAWVSGAQVSLVLSKSTAKAYLQNSATTDSYTRAQSLSDEVREKLNLNSTATPADAFEKLSNPLTTLAIGDLYHSANNIEELTNGAFLKLDGRVIDRVTGYPRLADVWELEYRIAYPTLIPFTHDVSYPGWSGSGGNGNRNSVAIGDSCFWISRYQNSTSYYSPLMFRSADGAVSTLLSQGVAYVVECNGYAIAFTDGSDMYVCAYVFDQNGTQVRKVQLSSSKYLEWYGIHVDGDLCVGIAYYNGTTNGWYSDDCFATYGTTTWTTATSGAPISYGSSAHMFNTINAGPDGSLYFITQSSWTSSPATYQLRIYKSTNGGKSFDFVGNYPNEKHGYSLSKWFIHNGYLYLLVQSNTQLHKVDLTTLSLVASSGDIYTGSFTIYGCFIHDDCMYVHHGASTLGDFKIDLNTLEFEPWVPYAGLKYAWDYYENDYVTRNGEYWILCTNASLVPTNSTSGEAIKDGIVVYHIPSKRAVYLTGNTMAHTNSSTDREYGRPFELANGSVVIPKGYRSDDDPIGYGLLLLDFDKITLPIQEYAYVKAMEVE